MVMHDWILALNHILVIFLAWQSIRNFRWKIKVEQKLRDCEMRLVSSREATFRAYASIAKISEDVDKRIAP